MNVGPRTTWVATVGVDLLPAATEVLRDTGLSASLAHVGTVHRYTTVEIHGDRAHTLDRLAADVADSIRVLVHGVCDGDHDGAGVVLHVTDDDGVLHEFNLPDPDQLNADTIRKALP